MRALAIIAWLLPIAAAGAQEPVCVRAATAPGFETFGAPAAAPLAIGKAVTVALSPDRSPAIVSAGDRPFKPGTTRGGVEIRIDKAGRYRIALSQKAWISVRGAGGEVVSVAHEHGPDCSGIAKIVSFDLAPGRYVIMLSEATGSTATVMVAAE